MGSPQLLPPTPQSSSLLLLWLDCSAISWSSVHTASLLSWCCPSSAAGRQVASTHIHTSTTRKDPNINAIHSFVPDPNFKYHSYIFKSRPDTWPSYKIMVIRFNTKFLILLIFGSFVFWLLTHISWNYGKESNPTSCVKLQFTSAKA